MSIYIYVCIITCCMYFRSTYICTYLYSCMNKYVHVCTHVWTHMYMYVLMYVHICTCMYSCMYAYVLPFQNIHFGNFKYTYMYSCMYTHVHVCTHVWTHMYMHVLMYGHICTCIYVHPIGFNSINSNHACTLVRRPTHNNYAFWWLESRIFTCQFVSEMCQKMRSCMHVTCLRVHA